MAGRLVRGFCTAAAATVAVGSLVAGGPASAEPGQPAPSPAAGSEGSHAAAQRRPQAPAGSGAGERPVDALLADLRRLYRESEDAAAAYRAAEQRLRLRRVAASGLTGRLARARHELHSSRAAAGRLARLQYQSSAGISPYVRLLLARDPQHALEQGRMLQRVSAARAAVIHRLVDDEKRAHGLSATARRALQAQERLAQRQKRRRDLTTARLHTVERLLAAATGQQHRNGDRERAVPQSRSQDTSAAQSPHPSDTSRSPASGGTHRPSKAGDLALQYALQQVGKPYRWGATGPDAFDCSGLTSQAWAHAGHPIPRTSQQQWAQLPRVSMDGLRPGDLVVYYPGATHVGLYAGDGKVVQAPRPGARVEVSPLHSNPVLGAVRPDQGEPSV